ncbi:RNA polymerase sigma-70 factor (ECF subfamily) [Rhabdobacter roseus]|uniref:RNA polymerase sigma-70 factor (ECF subfamily) n=1 Tax=Rhabdobacter roseus TaxID=1655419 RepID=A0A840TK31_9BACT|nr:RNA polymerase sigma-70 factor [Rhabdobacter roseus]MBB5283801.1 RNA polymerase sigma-70 factor (ECF subfamily) [Rhabdobacter roseus]
MGANRFKEDERQWLEDLVRGETASFTALYYRYGPRLHAHLLRMVKSEEEAREILQEVFLKIWEHRDRIDPDRPFGAYLYRIAENRVYDYFRKIAREKRMADHFLSNSVPFHTDPESDLQYRDSIQHLERAIQQLPPVRQKVYLLCKMEGKSYEEIAALLGISTATINDHIVKANRFIKGYLARYSDIVLSWLVYFWL